MNSAGVGGLVFGLLSVSAAIGDQGLLSNVYSVLAVLMVILRCLSALAATAADR